MSPRRSRPRRQQKPNRPAEGTDRYGLERTEHWRGEDWVVRGIAASAAAKHYRCPGCDQEIPPGMPHVVAWPVMGDADDRRHWHQPCWNARDRRGVRPQRPGKLPRF